ncbi:MAG: enoyl-ACP reductase [Planctomycetota bacterium]|nr:MAG: enoyl-ACP reductase [Planctomycetota bacterium]
MLEGKQGVVFGAANKNSLAWHIAQQAHNAGARVALAVANERFQERVAPLAEELAAPAPILCDVTSDQSIAAAFAELGRHMPRLDFLVHSIAFANKEDLERPFYQVSRDGFLLAQNVSAFSLVALARAAEPLLAPGASLLTLSYIGAVRSVPQYNVMGVAKAALEASVRYLAADLGPRGVRVNAISAGPIRTLSSAGIKGVRDMIDYQAQVNPLRRAIVGEDVGKAAVFLLSDYASGVTGDILYVDCGYHILGAYDVREG